MKLYGFGDSWCWGAELVDLNEEPVPIMRSGDEDGGFQRQFKPVNMDFRLKYRYINQLADHMGIPADDVVDMSQPSFSNDAIYRTILDWISTSGFEPGDSHTDLFVSIGWTSPERAEFFYGSRHQSYADGGWMTCGPWCLDEYNNPNHDLSDAPKLHKFFNLYYELFGEQAGALQRYIRTVWQTQQLLQNYGIPFVMHQAFYECRAMEFSTWSNDTQREEFDELLNDTDKHIWSKIDDTTFINKNVAPYTAHSFIKDTCGKAGFIVHHPSSDGHVAWAKYMHQFITRNNLV